MQPFAEAVGTKTMFVTAKMNAINDNFLTEARREVIKNAPLYLSGLSRRAYFRKFMQPRYMNLRR
jgi:hypothetical protein